MSLMDARLPLSSILRDALRRLAAERAGAYPERVVLPANCTIPTFKHVP
jgi:hypothetical protein